MSSKVFTYLGEEFKACSCGCHVVGQNIMHCFPCCNLCYASYIDLVDNKKVLNETLLDQALERAYKFRMEQKEKQNGTN